MKREDMLKKLDAGYEPINICIEKWEDQKNGSRDAVDSDTCALCEVQKRKFGYVTCSECPIRLATGEEFPCSHYLENPPKMLKALYKTKTWIEEQKCKEKEEEKEITCSIGDKVSFDNNEYIIASHSWNHIILINLNGGTRYSAPVKVEDSQEITIEEFKCLFHYDVDWKIKKRERS